MSGNSFGTRFKITSWGESHGPALGVVIDGCPPGIKLSEKDIQKEVDKRKPKKSSQISTSRTEEDKVKILSGVFEGKTTGMPISIIVKNKDANPKDYKQIKSTYRLGHADYTYELKYGIRDYRGGGRSSGRETVSRVMAGAVAKKILSKKSGKIEIFGHTLQVGNIKAENFDKKEIEKNELKCADKEAAKEMQNLIESIKEEKDSIGATVEIVIKNPPKGLGNPVFEKLDAELAKAIMSIGAVKGVEIGAGFKVTEMKGTQNNDKMEGTKFLSNNAGGILGGISNGEDIIIRLAVKPPPSIKIMGRHDTCLAPRVIPVAEAMTAIVLTDQLLINSTKI